MINRQLATQSRITHFPQKENTMAKHAVSNETLSQLILISNELIRNLLFEKDRTESPSPLYDSLLAVLRDEVARCNDLYSVESYRLTS